MGEDKLTDLSLAQLRPLLQQSRNVVCEMVKAMQQLIIDHTAASTAYDRAVARAIVLNLARAKSPAEKTPTILKALAEIDDEVIKAKDTFDQKDAELKAMTIKLKSAEEDTKSLKKAMGTIETEMRTFGG